MALLQQSDRTIRPSQHSRAQIRAFDVGASIAERGRMSSFEHGFLAVIGIAAAALLGACGGSDDDGGSGGAGGTSGSSGASGGEGVQCAGGAVCAAGQNCCVPFNGEASCAETCASGSTFSCDGPEDCGGKPCCGNAANGFSCATGDACESGVVERCHTSADCPDGQTCIPATMTPTGSTAAVPLDSCVQM